MLAGVAAAFLPMVDPAHRLAVAAPFSGFTLLLARTVSALAAALVPVAAAAFLLPGPGWLPIALLLPSLALCTFTLAATTVMDPRGAAVTAGALWALPALLLAASHVPLPDRAAGRAGRLLPCWRSAMALLVRRDHFEWGGRDDPEHAYRSHPRRGPVPAVRGDPGPGRGRSDFGAGDHRAAGPERRQGRQRCCRSWPPSTSLTRAGCRCSAWTRGTRRSGWRSAAGLGYLPQELGYHRHFTVAGFLDYVAILKEITDRRHRAEEVARVLAAVGLEHRARTRIRGLVRRDAPAPGDRPGPAGQPGCSSSTSRRPGWTPSSGCGSGSCCRACPATR